MLLWVLMNISVCFYLFCVIRCMNRFGLFCLLIVIIYCLILLVVVLGVLMLILIGLCRMFVVIVWILLENVVENSNVWCLVGNVVKIVLSLCVKLRLSMWLVLLSISVCIWLNCIVFWWLRLSKWFGVVMSMLMFLCSFIIWGLMFILL